jgi:hypothetical protein
MKTSDRFAACPHMYGPVGEVVGLFVNHLAPEALVDLEAALYDAASAEFDDVMSAELEEQRVYHRARWDALRMGASFVSGIVQARSGAAV